MVAQVNESMERIGQTTDRAEKAVARIKEEMDQFTF
jgi:uncharacterized protein YpuA (DUF1002 family)